ncbi:hypothetical protein [Ancylobacter terrae]|uniref:hypothetical protein n=1 Tax=Ancylobacter sp. sgz301288 TaxID=3342077 RepID=UPI00385C591D
MSTDPRNHQAGKDMHRQQGGQSAERQHEQQGGKPTQHGNAPAGTDKAKQAGQQETHKGSAPQRR